MVEGSSSNNSHMVNDSFSSSHKDTFILGWDSRSNCITRNGVIAPNCVNWHSSCGESSSVADLSHHEQAQQISSSRRKSRRHLSKAVLDQVIGLTFRLLKCQNEEGYILEMTEVEKWHDHYYILHPVEGKDTLKTKVFRTKEVIVREVTEDVEPPPDNKYKLTLRERIEGKWHVETRKRDPDSDTVDKFYYHEKVKNAIRSLPDVATFILYGEIPEIERKKKRKLDQVTGSSAEMIIKEDR